MIQCCILNGHVCVMSPNISRVVTPEELLFTKQMIVLPPKLRLCLFFIPEFKSSSSSSSWIGDRTPPSQPIMAGIFSWRNGGSTPVTHRHSQILAKKLQYGLTHVRLAGEMPEIRSYQSCGHSLWSSVLWLPAAWGASQCWRSSSL